MWGTESFLDTECGKEIVYGLLFCPCVCMVFDFCLMCNRVFVIICVSGVPGHWVSICKWWESADPSPDALDGKVPPDVSGVSRSVFWVFIEFEVVCGCELKSAVLIVISVFLLC